MLCFDPVVSEFATVGKNWAGIVPEASARNDLDSVDKIGAGPRRPEFEVEFEVEGGPRPRFEVEVV